jgi:transcription elongation factor Elf1
MDVARGVILMRKQNGIQLRTFRCPICSREMTAPKMQSRKTGIGHPKNMRCWFCGQEEVPLIQIDSQIVRYSC